MADLNPFTRITQRGLKAMLEAVQEELWRMAQHLVHGTFNPEMLAQLMQAMGGSVGIDPSQLSGMMAQQGGFDPYKILVLDKSASDDEVQKRYRELLRKLHPDTAGVKGTELLFQMVLAAYESIKRERRWA